MSERFLFRPALLARVAAGRYPVNQDVRTFVRRTFGLERSPFGLGFRGRLLRRFPAHLHVNVEEAARGLGIGRALVERFLSDLSAEGVQGVHLVCGPEPVGFYRRLGFEVLEERRRDALPIACMARSL